jgi:steroid delta-isomerase-like uncharacterized protein
MSTEENKALMRRYYQEIWHEGNIAAGDELVALDIVDHMPGPDQPPGRVGHDATVAMVHTAFPDAEFTVEDLLGEDDKVVGRWTMRATHTGNLMGIPPTGKSIVMSGIDIGRWENGRLVEIWHIEDIMGMMMQLGVVPGFE